MNHTLRIMQSLSAADGKGILRDPLLRVMLVVPFGLAAAVRWLLPGVAAAATAQFGVDIGPTAQLLAGYIMLILPPMLCGMLVGFLFLDQRDEQTLLALRVSPLPLAGFLAFRLGMPTLLSILGSTAALIIAGVVQVPFASLLAVTGSAALVAPVTALFLTICATNKVQGLALQKLLSVPLLLPALGVLLPTPWDLIATTAPTFWPAHALWQLQRSGSMDWGACLLALAYQGVIGVFLLRKLPEIR